MSSVTVAFIGWNSVTRAWNTSTWNTSPTFDVTATGAVGSATITGNANVSVTGVAGTSALGNLFTTNMGVTSTGAVGSATITGNANVSVTGVAGTTTLGSFFTTNTMVTMTASVNSASTAVTGNANVTVTGVSATGEIGILQQPWGLIIPSQTPNFSGITPTQSPSWADVAAQDKKMASTYVNDLRLEEIGSGEQSGSWGDTTNTNLELIAEAFSFGTEAITTNADTHTTTIADGATDPGRSLFLKYTGTLDSACTITIAPNTVSKLWFIENGTSGSQNIIISQGSGANITIPPGDTKAIYSDGAGSGAAMVDAFASLSVVDLKVQDDLTVTDDVAIGGLATVGGTLGVTGVATFGGGTSISTAGVLSLEAGGNLTTAAGNDLNIVYPDGRSLFFKEAGTTTLTLDNAQGATFAGVVTANAGVVVDNITIDGQEIDVSSGDLTLDVAGDIILDADGEDIRFKDGGVQSFIFTMGAASTISAPRGNLAFDVAGNITLDADGGYVQFFDGGTEHARIFTDNSGDVNFSSQISDKDMKFLGNDDGSSITALTLDMSNGGTATFYRKIIVSAADGVADADYVASFTNNESTSGRSFGLSIGAGTSGGDIALNVGNQAGDTTLLRVHGNGATTIGNSLTLADGNLVVANGHGINFAAQTDTSQTGAGATNELLSHYEEGNWTPVMFSGSSTTQPAAYAIQEGRYVRVGSILHYQGRLKINGLGSVSGNPRIGGLPFTVINDGAYPATTIGWANGLNITAGQTIAGTPGPNTTAIELRIWNSAAGVSDMTAAEFSDDGDIIFSGTFEVV